MKTSELKKIDLKEWKAQISETKNKNRKEQLRAIYKLAKAAQSGKFVTVDDLKEYKGLIIWNIKRASYGYNLVKEVMEEMLKMVENKEVGYVTKRGIKGIISKLANNITLRMAEGKLRQQHGIDILTGAMEDERIARFQEYKLSKIK